MVRNVHINPRTKAKVLVKMLAEAGKSVSLSTVNRLLYQHGLKGYSPRRKPLLPKKCKKKPDYCLQMHTGTKSLIFGDMSCGQN